MLALVLVLTQLHFCESTYVRDSGLVCQECLAIDDHGAGSGELDGPHGDCHDCCQLRECETPQTFEAPTSSQQAAFDFAILPEPLVLPVVIGGGVPSKSFPFASGAPATGPPLVHLSRGPPTLFLVPPYAGRKVESLA
jgi:hypothetical protein